MIPWFQWTTIHLGPLTLQVWGLFVSLGMLLALLILWKRGRGESANPQMLLDLAFWMIVGGFVFARLFHALFYEPAFYLAHPIEIFKVWNGGLSSFGGIFGAALGFFAFAYFKGVLPKGRQYLWRIADRISYAALFGWMVGRIGCFMIHDHLGTHSNCPLAIKTPDGPRFDMALLEIFGLIPLAILFFLLRKRKMADGWYTSVLFVYYGLLRFILDFWRATDIPNADARYLGLTPAQYFAILLVLCGSRMLTRKHGRIA